MRTEVNEGPSDKVLAALLVSAGFIRPLVALGSTPGGATGPSFVPEYEQLYLRSLGAGEARPVKQLVSGFAKEFGVHHRRTNRLRPSPSWSSQS